MINLFDNCIHIVLGSILCIRRICARHDRYENSNIFTRQENRKEMNNAEYSLKLQCFWASMGKQTDYTKFEGMRDLADQTSALKEIRDQWNEAYDNGKLNDKITAIVTNSFIDGDFVVSRYSQGGGEFKGINTKDIIVPQDKNMFDYMHTNITKNDEVIDFVRALLNQGY
ncbi:MAG: hypothetical protein KBA50_10130 [Sedimentibacter sp.]|nr:hypothetical protein [Sedimentibacter sp.]